MVFLSGGSYKPSINPIINPNDNISPMFLYRSVIRVDSLTRISRWTMSIIWIVFYKRKFWKIGSISSPGARRNRIILSWAPYKELVQ
jgi:hypothetical protein